VSGDLEVKISNNAVEISEHEGCFFHDCSYTSVYIHSNGLLYVTIYDISQLFYDREINKHNTNDYNKQLLRNIITYSEIPLKSFLLYVSVVMFCPKQTLSSFTIMWYSEL